jgi:hypothetical protein
MIFELPTKISLPFDNKPAELGRSIIVHQNRDASYVVTVHFPGKLID